MHAVKNILASLFLFLILILSGCGTSDPGIIDGDMDYDFAEVEEMSDGDPDEAEIAEKEVEDLDADEESDETEQAEFDLELDAEDETVEYDEETEVVEPRLFWVKNGSIASNQADFIYLRGTNISNLAKTAEDHLYDLTAEDVELLKSSGINMVRLLTFWNAIAPTADSIDQGYLDAYLERVQLLTDAGIYVIVDMHQDLWGEPFQPHGAPSWACPEELKEGFVWQEPWWMNYLSTQVSGCFDYFLSNEEMQNKFVAAWVAMAEKVSNEELVLGFDIINEPFAYGGVGNRAFDNEVLSPLYQKVMTGIEQVCPGRIFFWEHSAGFVAGLSDAYQIPQDLQDRVVVSPHFYPKSVHEIDEQGYLGTLEELESDLMFILQVYTDAKVPLWMGEYGGMTNNPGFAEYLQQIHSIFLKYGIHSAQYGYEPNDGGFAFIDSKSQLKDVFKPVFLMPTPAALPEKPSSMEADWEAGSMETKFNCTTGKTIKVITANSADTCLFEPANNVAEFVSKVGQTTTSCLKDGPVTLSCQRALEPDGDMDQEME